MTATKPATPAFGVRPETPDAFRSLICSTMPSTGIASGFCSAAPAVTDAARQAAAAYGPAYAGRSDLTSVTAWLASLGLPAGRAFAAAARGRLILQRIAAADTACVHADRR